MKLYLAGGMTGYEDFNKPAFFRGAAELRCRGHEVLNPAEHEEKPGMDWIDYMRKDLRLLSQCEAVAVLPGWNKSRGARLEVYIAVSLGMPVFDAENMEQYALTIASLPEFAIGGLAEVGR